MLLPFTILDWMIDALQALEIYIFHSLHCLPGEGQMCKDERVCRGEGGSQMRRRGSRGRGRATQPADVAIMVVHQNYPAAGGGGGMQVIFIEKEGQLRPFC